MARLIANFHRRQITREEKEAWINGLAGLYQKQGLKVSQKVGSAQAINQIKNKKPIQVTQKLDFRRV
jgi:hypothetical protein